MEITSRRIKRPEPFSTIGKAKASFVEFPFLFLRHVLCHQQNIVIFFLLAPFCSIRCKCGFFVDDGRTVSALNLCEHAFETFRWGAVSEMKQKQLHNLYAFLRFFSSMVWLLMIYSINISSAQSCIYQKHSYASHCLVIIAMHTHFFVFGIPFDVECARRNKAIARRARGRFKVFQSYDNFHAGRSFQVSWMQAAKNCVRSSTLYMNANASPFHMKGDTFICFYWINWHNQVIWVSWLMWGLRSPLKRRCMHSLQVDECRKTESSMCPIKDKQMNQKYQIPPIASTFKLASLLTSAQQTHLQG